MTTPPTTTPECDRLLVAHDAYPLMWITPTIALGPMLPRDADQLIVYMNTLEVAQYLLTPPFPYLRSDAEGFIGRRHTRMTPDGTLLLFAIRDMAKAGDMIGIIDVIDAGFGYWLSPAYHRQGIMFKAGSLLIQEIILKKLNARTITGSCFKGNIASAKTMEKLGLKQKPETGELLERLGKKNISLDFEMTLTDEDIAKRPVILQATPLPGLDVSVL